jgi:hypothetical protein
MPCSVVSPATPIVKMPLPAVVVSLDSNESLEPWKGGVCISPPLLPPPRDDTNECPSHKNDVSRYNWSPSRHAKPGSARGNDEEVLCTVCMTHVLSVFPVGNLPPDWDCRQAVVFVRGLYGCKACKTTPIRSTEMLLERCIPGHVARFTDICRQENWIDTYRQIFPLGVPGHPREHPNMHHHSHTFRLPPLAWCPMSLAGKRAHQVVDSIYKTLCLVPLENRLKRVILAVTEGEDGTGDCTYYLRVDVISCSSEFVPP